MQERGERTCGLSSAVADLPAYQTIIPTITQSASNKKAAILLINPPQIDLIQDWFFQSRDLMQIHKVKET